MDVGLLRVEGAEEGQPQLKPKKVGLKNDLADQVHPLAGVVDVNV